MVEIPLPKNLSRQYVYLFKDRFKYRCRITELRKIKSAFVTYEGLVLKNGLLVDGSAFNLYGKEDHTFLWPFWKLSLEQFLVSRFGKSLRSVQLTAGPFLHVNTKWFGFYFWMTSQLPRLIKTRHLHNEAKLIFPKNWWEIPYVMETLKLFPDLKLEVLPVGTHAFVKELLLPETQQWSNEIDPDTVALTRQFVFNYLDRMKIKRNFGEKIYISRGKAGRRGLSNASEAEAVLNAHGFKPVNMEDYPLLEQISIVRKATEVVGLHGAGLSLTQFMPPESKVVEISPQVNNIKDFRVPFWRIAAAVSLQYFIIFSKPTADGAIAYDTHQHVNMTELVAVIS